VSLSRLPSFLHSILVSIQNDWERQGVILNGCEGSAPVMRQAFFQEGIVDFQKPESGLRRLKTSWQQKGVPDV
jgi:hypothetical protein